MQWYFGNRADEIIDGVWLGDLVAAHDTDFLEDNNIKLLINCTLEYPFHPNLPKDIKTMRIPVRDSGLAKDKIKMQYYIENSLLEMLRTFSDHKGNILVHCYAGKQRSSILVACFLKMLNDLSNGYFFETTVPLSRQLDECIKLIRNKRYKAFGYGLYVNFRETFFSYFSS